MNRCDSCKAKNQCLAAVEPGSIMCTLNLMRSGHTHGDEQPPKTQSEFCQYCGARLERIGTALFCSNMLCINRYVDLNEVNR